MLIDFLVIVGINLVRDVYTKFSIYSIYVPDLVCLCFGGFFQEIYRITIICDLKSLFVTKTTGKHIYIIFNIYNMKHIIYTHI